MATGSINVSVENIFPLIKKFLYSDHEIFLRELISNATDATTKLKHLTTIGEAKVEYGNPIIEVKIDKDAKTLTIKDQGIGMTGEEVEKYINQVAFSGAEEFLEKYVFYDLEDLNDGFDSPSIKYFSKDDFEKILDRAEFYGLKIFGIEPWPDRQFFNVRVYEEYDTSADNPEWYRDAYDRFLEEGVTSYFSATYGVPENLLKKFLI